MRFRFYHAQNIKFNATHCASAHGCYRRVNYFSRVELGCITQLELHPRLWRGRAVQPFCPEKTKKPNAIMVSIFLTFKSDRARPI